jgi:hypothetical protein
MEKVHELTQKLDLTRARRERVAKQQAAGRRAILTLEDQSAIFGKLFPQGFDGYNWRAEVRGTAAARRLKAHRQPAIDDAKRLLSLDALAPLVESGDHAAIVQRLIEVGRGTNLVRPKQDAGMLKGLEGNRLKAVACAAVSLLHGEAPIKDRFNIWISALSHGDDTPSWQLATVFTALLFPKEHICVRPSAFREQSRWMAPRLKYDSTPKGALYARYRAMSRLVRRTVKQKSDLRMNDLMDTYEFMVQTLRPKARKLLQQKEAA